MWVPCVGGGVAPWWAAASSKLVLVTGPRMEEVLEASRRAERRPPVRAGVAKAVDVVRES